MTGRHAGQAAPAASAVSGAGRNAGEAAPGAASGAGRYAGEAAPGAASAAGRYAGEDAPVAGAVSGAGRYAGKAALVTGAASGVGRATALRLAAEGARVACLDLVPAGLGGLDLTCDLRAEDQVRDAVRRAVDWAGRLDLVANVAGVAAFGHTTEVSLAEWERILAVNLTGTFLVTREALPHLVESRGAVVNVASLAGVRGWRYSAAYSASKGGVVALTRALAVEYAGRGVRVSCVCPGSVDTPLRAGLTPVPNKEAALEGHGRALVEPPVAQPDEIAGAIVYLGSAEARFATGAVLRMDGGAGV